MMQRAVYIQLIAGAVRLQWCDRCMVSHAFANVYGYTEGSNDMPSRLCEWADHNDDEPVEL